jgi:alpha-tubulin suppressor-like RCC1 family protein
MYCWGYNGSGQVGDNAYTDRSLPVQVHGVGNVGTLNVGSNQQMTLGMARSCVLNYDSNSAYCWGWGTGGALGNNNNGVDSATPVQVQGITDPSQIVSGHGATCVLRATGDVVCFGAYGGDYALNAAQTGNDSGVRSLTPTAVNVGVPSVSGTWGGAVSINSFGFGNHFCVRDSSNQAACWGSSTDGQIGDNTYANRMIPKLVVSTAGTGVLANVSRIAPGQNHSCAMTTGGSAYCWGYATNGGLGNNTATYPGTTKPVQVVGSTGSGTLANVTDISTGQYFSCALLSSGGGTVYCWGNNGNGQLGDNTLTQRNYPQQVHGVGNVGMLTGISNVIAGYEATCALTTGGEVYCWGRNNNGQLGDNTTTDRRTPALVVGVGGTGTLGGIVKVAAGPDGFCAVSGAGNAYCWGAGANGQLGHGSSPVRSTKPVQVLNTAGTGPLTDVIDVSLGSYYACFETSGGIVSCTGNNDYGQLGNNNQYGTSNIPVLVIGLP